MAKGKKTTKDSLVQSTVRLALDAWQNIATGLGTASRDKRLSGQIVAPAVASDRSQYENLFISDDIAARIVELPSREMLREWITVQIGESEEEGQKTEELEERANTANEVMNKLDTLKARTMLYKALVWARVHGGSLMFLGVDDGKELSEPLDVNAIRSFNYLEVFDRWDVSITERYKEGEKIGQPELYTLQASVTGGQIDNPIIHESRFIRFEGVLTSRDRMNDNGGWSDSIYVRTESVLRDFGIAWGGVAHLLQDFAQGIFKMRGLQDAIASDNDNLVLTRIAAMDLCRGVSRLIPIDAEDEDFIRQQTPVSGLPELMDRFATRLAAAAEMPLTLLMGQSPAGLNATGESDLTQWYNQISNRQETELRDPVEWLLTLIFLAADGPTKGKEPDNWSFVFDQLWQLDRKEEAETRKINAESDSLYIQNGVLDPDEVAVSRFGGDAYGDEISLDVQAREEGELTEADIDAAVKQAQDKADSLHQDKIEKRGSEWLVLSADGKKVLGKHKTKEEAIEQLRAIEASKAK